MEGTAENIRVRKPSESNLAAIALDQNLKTILVTAANSGSGTTSSSLSLARELALANREKVLLIDANFTDAELTRSRGLQDAAGLLELLAQPRLPLADHVTSCADLPFEIMPIGCSGDLDGKAVPELFAVLSEHYRFIILDGDAVYTSSSLVNLAAQVDGVVLVVRAEETRWEVAQAATQRLHQADAHVIGSIFNARRYYMPKWIYDNL